MPQESDAQKVQRFHQALQRFIDRVRADRYVLAVVLEGSLSEDVIWQKESIGVWVIERDGVSKRLRSDGKDERIFRVFVEDGVNLHAEVIPRSRFKQMVEGSSRTAFSCNFFARRELVYSDDPSIDKWFDEANEVAAKDQEKELLAFTTWTIYAHRHATKRLEIKRDLDLAKQAVLWAAHSVAHTEMIRSGEVCETDVIYRAMEANPELFEVIYSNVLGKRKGAGVLKTALHRIDEYLVEHHTEHLKPLLSYLRKQGRVVPLSEISDHFAFSQLYPWHLESACEWLEKKGMLEKLATPFKLTTKSREEVEEPAYFLDS